MRPAAFTANCGQVTGVSGYLVHPEADVDLDEIWEHIAAHNVDCGLDPSTVSCKLKQS
jgi:hypothetical protein